MCFKIKVLASLQVILEFSFFTFPKKWVGRAMGNKTFYGDGLTKDQASVEKRLFVGEFVT